MKTVLKLVIAVAFLNAVIRGADSMWSYYKLKDEAQRMLLFGSTSTTEELQSQILSAAADLEIPLTAERLSVRRDGRRAVAEASYTQQVEFFPNYPYPIEFSFVVDSVAISPGVPEKPRKQ
jgi:hypothetical protein